jgi:hypothetical protein
MKLSVSATYDMCVVWDPRLHRQVLLPGAISINDSNANTSTVVSQGVHVATLRRGVIKSYE